ncbi:Stalked cell differentiation-controlling protein [Anaerohalosphaera lusitana]|uniref:diguanylate cyclase n=1 Tax=Anaerohalosphaera lusitana TaxID=1936003 RepID=A0A1U9NK62_9BACT|nr:GGDEF domain-containing protein [Anaerohalosphaera lusitana]AQT67970.1 Stalked cell differentiation-controlling protein [Anaerohalosphaera lusitana]
MKTVEDNSTARSSKVLFVGNPLAAFENVEQTLEHDFKRCENMLDAINAAAHQPYETIYVVMSCFTNKLESAIRTLRRVNGSARIVLLARMHEEFQARQLVATPVNRGGVADDYMICPVKVDEVFGEKTAESYERTSAKDADVDRQKDARIRELEKLAIQDDLTNLKNRRYVREFLGQILKKAQELDLWVTLLVFDIDNFKHYNDAYGHSVGDKVLIEAGEVIKNCCREHDVIARIGGDEFAVVFWDRPGDRLGEETVDASGERRRPSKGEHPDNAYQIAERFRRQISATKHEFLGPEGKGVLTISGGLASYPRDGQTVEQLFEQADMAMLEAKRSGKNRVYLVGPEGKYNPEA